MQAASGHVPERREPEASFFLKADVRSLTILGSVGYNKDSISLFRRELSDVNGIIPQPNDRIPEHELCLIMLKNISKAAPHLAAMSDGELKAPPAERTLVYPPTHPLAGLRSITAIVAHFEPLWKAAIERGAVPLRVASKKGKEQSGSIVGTTLVEKDERLWNETVDSRPVPLLY